MARDWWGKGGRFGGATLALFALLALLHTLRRGGGADVELSLAYIANIIILVPVGLATLLSRRAMQSVFEGRFPDSDGLRVIVGSMWIAILAGSAIGLYYPREMVGILVVQVIYKALFLVVYALPAFVTGQGRSVPRGMSFIFLIIVIFWPVIMYRGLT